MYESHIINLNCLTKTSLTIFALINLKRIENCYLLCQLQGIYLMKLVFIPHQFSLMGYFKFFFKRKVNFLVFFPISLFIILGAIYIYGTRIWYNPRAWLEEVQQKDVFLLISKSIGRFLLNLINLLPFIVSFYIACVVGYHIIQ